MNANCTRIRWVSALDEVKLTKKLKFQWLKNTIPVKLEQGNTQLNETHINTKKYVIFLFNHSHIDVDLKNCKKFFCYLPHSL